MKKYLMIALLAAGPVYAQGMPSTEGAEVYFINLADGDTVQSPLTVRFGLTGMGVAPAGVEQEGTGHHHVFINRAPLGEGEFGADEFIYPIPNDEAHRHFGGGQTETMLDLPSGEHTLQMVFGDHNHVPHDPPVTSDVITITVE